MYMQVTTVFGLLFFFILVNKIDLNFNRWQKPTIRVCMGLSKDSKFDWKLSLLSFDKLKQKFETLTGVISIFSWALL